MENGVPAAPNGSQGLEHQLMKAESVLNQPFVLVSLLYTLAIPVSLAVRTSNMSLVNARPQDTVSHHVVPGPDKWITANTLGMALAIIWFTPVTMFNFYIISHLMMQRPAGSPRMSGIFAWVAPSAITLMTLAYFLSYISLARYAIQVMEWVLFLIFAAVLLLGSFHVICCNRLKQADVIETQEAEHPHGP